MPKPSKSAESGAAAAPKPGRDESDALRSRLLFERNLAGVYRSTVDGKIVDCNDSFARMLGCADRAEALQATVFDFYRDPGERHGTIERLRRERQLDNYELRLQRRDGSVLWLLENVSLVEGPGGEEVLEGTVIDITAQKLAQEKVQQRELYYRALIERASDIITLLDGAGGILYESPSVERVLGYTPAELIGRNVFRGMHQDDVATARAAFRHVAETPGGDVIISLCRFKHKGSGWRTLEVTASNLLDDPLVRGIVVNARDVTERQAAQQALVESEAKFRAVAETATCGIYIHDGKRLLYVNQALSEITGYSRAELLTGDPWDIVHPDYREHMKENYAGRMRGENIPRRYEFKILRKDGEEGWLDFSTNPIQVEGTTCLLATVFDVTERMRAEQALRKSEERFRELYENANDLIFTTDLEGNITSVNQMTLKVTGFTREEALTKNVFRIVVPEHQARALESMQKKLMGEGETRYEIDILAKGDRHITLELATRLIYKDGKPMGAQAIARDISERRHLEQQLRQAQKMEAVGRLAGGVAHDFNNLLMVIRGYTELMLDGIPEEDARHAHAEKVLRASDRAHALTQQLLAFGRKQVSAPKIMSLTTVLNDMAKMLPPLIGEDVELTIVNDLGLGNVKADPGHIEQVIMNLATNARDAMPGGGRLRLETANVSVGEIEPMHPGVAPGKYVLLSVSDSGHGMDEQTQARLFEPFFTTKERGKGTGLGLSTVYGIVKQAGGYINFITRKEQGTTFRVYLPRVEAEREDGIALPASRSAYRGTETVLLVEDEEEVRKVTRQFLQRNGYKVLEASNGMEALQVAQRYIGAIQLLLTDVVMPAMNGAELRTRLLAQRPNIKVLFMSGYTGDSLPGAAAAIEPEALLQKPFTFDMLSRKVREALGRAVSA
jgi:PAS domain S-box-containing protein